MEFLKNLLSADLVSLVVLVAAIVIAFVCKVNTGLVAMVAALIVGRIFGVADKTLLKSFDSSLFLMLLGVMYLFGIAQENNTLDLLAKKVIALCRGKVALFPIAMFLLAAVLSGIGPGLISVTALVAVMSVALAKQSGIEPIKLLPFGTLGSFAGGLTPMTPSGMVALNNATASGIDGIVWPLALNMALTCVLFSVGLYFFVFKWHKQKSVKPNGDAAEKTPPFTLKQWLTLIGILLVAILAILQVNVGLASFAVAVVLTILKCADESKVIKRVPWNTLVMITGVGILISLVTDLGGIDLLSSLLQKLMGMRTAAAIMTVLAGVMSWFSSASGVVMPTLIPTVPGIVENLSGVSALGITVGLCIGAHMAALSPLSSCGGLMLAAYSSSENVTEKERNRTFVHLFIMSASGVLFAALLALVGLYR